MLRARQNVALLDWIKQLLFPIHCLNCHKESDWICLDCLEELTILNDQRCAICKKAAVGGICVRCRKTTGLDGIIAPLDYQSPLVRDVVSVAKYQGGWDALICLITALEEYFIRKLPEGDWCYTFVPQTKTRYLERGYNQSEILARQLSRGKMFSGLVKTKETATQASLTRKQRQLNLKNAFRLKGKPPEQVVICDDVITTGSTLSAVARLLKRSGAKRVWAITLAHD